MIQEKDICLLLTILPFKVFLGRTIDIVSLLRAPTKINPVAETQFCLILKGSLLDRIHQVVSKLIKTAGSSGAQ